MRINYIIIGYAIVVIEGVREREILIYRVNKIIGEEKMYNIGITESMEITLRMVVVIGIIWIIPQIWMEVYSGVSGGMKREEQKELRKLMIYTTILMYMGIKVGVGEIIPRIAEWMEEISKGEVIEMEYMKMYRRSYEEIERMVLGVVIVTQIPVMVRILRRRKRGIRMEKIRRLVYIIGMLIGGIIGSGEISSQVMIGGVVVMYYEGVVIRELYERKSRYEKGEERGR